MGTLCIPFKTQVLRSQEEPKAPSQVSGSDFSELLPASRRTTNDHIVVPQLDRSFLQQELLVRRLNDIQDWLWLCGRPMPPRPLHHQILLSREIAISENPELHLVWSKNRMFLKPIPLYLLVPDFWATHIIHDEELTKCARGYLYSYAALIMYQSDFRIAQEKGLLPLSITWDGWRNLAKEVLDGHAYASVNPRYWYGELRLSRLNKIYRIRKGFILRGYSKIAAHTVYGDLIRDNFAALATILGYVVIVLTAMQVGLGVERLQEDEAFQNASYGFTVFSIIAPLAAGIGIFLVVLIVFVSNWIATKNYEGKRFQKMGVEPFWREDKAKDKGKSRATEPTD
ncbi:uncharacterized protein F4812DRAFT_302662 [Daldinia caldariorum]|uniref:uncharacterized protein n=1 Tax=Daldinia caldariorum TaxID=326644 RepID=UPI0020088932|nr:uncharacterized protein F4812DRAFT_302662 [Daldinia caldariorum]KAI1469769.1 hypothetical protein F4812DRAFT_302662 [Daldinia caldariorum]